MASKGKYALGTDGTDYLHRQRVVSSHSISADAKYYLKFTFYLHFLLNALVILKLSEDVLDRMDIFILELQELEIPKPHLWEWIYGISFLPTLFAARAIKTNSARLMNLYQITTWSLAIIPLLIGQCYYAPDFIAYLQERDLETLAYVWRSLPISVVF